MRNEVIYDKNGRPDIMVVFTPSELGLPDTLRGRKVKEYAISKYPNTLIDGVPHSLPFMKPAVNISHDEAIRLCESKGEGWHLITNDEWVALGFWSWDNDTMPTGNTASGKSHSHPEQTGTTYEGGCGKTLTGSGPVQWNHDGTAYGVADMCGNIWEHVGGVRFMDGMPQVIPNNGAAYGADQSKDSTEWEAIYTEDGDPVYYNVHGGEITLQPVHPDGTDYDGVKFTDREVRSDMDVPDKLKDLGLYPADGYESDEYFWLDSDGERVIYRGGYWNPGANAGVFYLNGNNSRSNVNTNIGFRAALALFVYFLRAKAQQKHQGKRDAFPGRQGQRYTLVLLCRWRPPGTPSKPRRLAVVCYAGRRGIRILRRGDRRGKISPRNVTTRAIIMTTQGGTRTWIQETSPPFWREYTRGRIFWTHTTRQQARSGTATT